MRMRVAVGSILTECNQFGGSPINIQSFERQELRKGVDMLEVNTGVVGGTLQTFKENQVEVVPLLYASSCPGGPITTECYLQLKDELIGRLKNAMPVDGVLLPLHGASVVEDLGDSEGDLIKSVRYVVGDQVPIVVTLDLHAHVTDEMIRFAQALIAWETYPHCDTFSTGIRGAKILLSIITGETQPTMAMAKVPVITSAIHGSTGTDSPFSKVMNTAKQYESDNDVVSTSVFLVHPYIDQPDMGSGGLVITNNNMDKAINIANKLSEQYWGKRFELEPQVHTPQEAIQTGLKTSGGPILLVEAADCCGGGASGDSIASLAALLKAEVTLPSLVPVVDPKVAEMCHKVGIGQEIRAEIGYQIDSRWGKPISIIGRVVYLSQGDFQYTGGIWDGSIGKMGPSAVIALGSIQVLVTTYATYDWANEQFRSVGLDTSAAKFIVVKNPMNYQFAYGDIAKSIFILDTPGPTPATCRYLQYERLQRPYFPADEYIANLSSTILTN